MLYPKKDTEKLDIALFENPTKEYRAAPFWSWNCELKKETLEKQIEIMREMGFGGYYMHTRVGMATPYLSDEFMDLIGACIEKGKEVGMNSYLYDEDRWPSGTAGGFTVKESEENRQKVLHFTYSPYNDGTLVTPSDISKSKEVTDEKFVFLACFDILLNSESRLVSYKRIPLEADVPENHEKWFAYMEYGGYCDVMRKETIDTFIKLTHEKYKERFGNEFQEHAPTIFTDEPQMYAKKVLDHASDKTGIAFPYTNDFDKTFKEKYGISIEDHFPVLVWELSNGTVSPIRYYYHDHSTERFAEAFCDNIGKWCEDNGIIFTGHMMNEGTLFSQTTSVGEAMRHYRGFQLPGIDMLCDYRELNTAKQAQSAARQYGKEGVMSELYGVTNWDFDFRGHKLQGDWQAAMGITHRVPHLYWVSMGGEAKRDYPASIGHQSPWYKEYPHIENHFARVNTVMTRGTPDVRIAVIHPIESYWLHFGPADQTGTHRSAIGNRFDELTKWLLFGLHDFDFVCESLLPEQYEESENGFTIGKMKYQTVIVPYLETIRKTTLDALKKFRKAGGEVIFMGQAPIYVDAIPSNEAIEFSKECKNIPWSDSSLLEAIESQKFLDIRKNDGYAPSNLIYQLRDDNGCKNLFISHVDKEDYDVAPVILTNITLKGEWTVQEYDTLNGKKQPLSVVYKNGNTVFPWINAVCDSLLLELTPGRAPEQSNPYGNRKKFIKTEHPVHQAAYSMEEPNVLLLDRPSYSFKGSDWSEPTDVLKIDEAIRRALGDTTNRRKRPQPWQIPLDKNPKELVSLRFTFESEIEYEGAHLAMEYPEYSEIIFNSENVPVRVDGTYVDDAIQTVLMPKIKKGSNELIIKLRYGNIDSVESYYLLGNFGVEVHGYYAKITTLPDVLYFDSITNQKMGFYGGNLKYTFQIMGGGKKTIEISKYRGAVIKVLLDGNEKGYIDFPPHRLDLGEISEGEHTVDLILYGNRMNTFGQLHKTNEHLAWTGPDSWRTKGRFWTDEYMLTRTGILTAPAILTEEN